LSQWATPIAVVALLGISTKLTLDGRAAERSHRAAAENALRDYARFAGWQYSRHLTMHMRQHLMMSLAPVREIRLRSGGALPHPSVLSDRAKECDCGFRADLLFAFRLDLRDGSLLTDRVVAAPTLRSIGRFLPPAIDRITANLTGERRAADPEGFRDMLRLTTAIAFDTLGGQPLVIAYGLILEDMRRPRAVYGVASLPDHFAGDYARFVGHEALLPPSLVNGRSNDSLLAIRTLHPTTGLVYESSVPPAAPMLIHTDTSESWLGGQITQMAIRPEFAGTLLIGGIPPSRLPLQLALLGVAAAMALLALVQLRRTRELGRLREQFVANVSHELRTPLAQISMLSETLMLGRERSEAERRDFASVVYREARRLTTLVERVMRFSRGQATGTGVQQETKDVAVEVHGAVSAFEPLAHAAEATIESNVPADLAVRVDPGAFRQVMLNLLDNAVKFGPRGQRVVVNAETQNGMVVVSVTDQGRGIPEGERRRVFNPYTRVDAPGAPAVAGAGIGLSVVHDLVTAHGGRVWIEPAPAGNGTSVRFSVPRSA
jgi:signal transduction histidine kinase